MITSSCRFWNTGIFSLTQIWKESLCSRQRQSVLHKVSVRVAAGWGQVPEIPPLLAGQKILNDFIKYSKIRQTLEQTGPQPKGEEKEKYFCCQMQSILVLTSRLRDVCWGTKMKWLLWQFKLVLVVATCRVRAVLHHFYDEFFLHSETFSANCVRFHYLQKFTVRLVVELHFYNSKVKYTIHSRNTEDILYALFWVIPRHLKFICV